MGTLVFKFSLPGSVISLPCNKKKGLYPVFVLGAAQLAIWNRGLVRPGLCALRSHSVIGLCKAISVFFLLRHSMLVVRAHRIHVILHVSLKNADMKSRSLSEISLDPLMCQVTICVAYN